MKYSYISLPTRHSQLVRDLRWWMADYGEEGWKNPLPEINERLINFRLIRSCGRSKVEHFPAVVWHDHDLYY